MTYIEAKGSLNSIVEWLAKNDDAGWESQIEAGAAPQDEGLPQESFRPGMDHENLKVTTCFHNKAGQYELTRVVDGQVYYSFKNQHGKTVDSTMPLIMWQKIAARATQG